VNILVCGAGTVGRAIAEMLCQNRHNVAIVDQDPAHCRRVNEELDAKVVTGSASEASILFQAGVLDADLCLTVTGSDEVNLVAASMAKAMGTRRAIARVYAPVFHDLSTFDYQRHFKIDRLLSLEHLSAVELARYIRHPGSLAVEIFAQGDIEVQELSIEAGAPVLEAPIKDLGLPKGIRIGSILRAGRIWIVGAQDHLQAGDRVTLIGKHEDVDKVRDMFQKHAPPKRGIVIAGGGETGLHLARLLDKGHFRVQLMESDRDRCSHLAARLKHTTVVNANATLRAHLEEERVGTADVFVACTGEDEDNIMACVEARDLGAKTILAIVGRPDYASVVGKLGIDMAVSPRQVMTRQVQSFLTTGVVVSRNTLGGGGVTVIEVEVPPGCPATEHSLAKLNLPPQCLIAAVMRDEFARVPGADDKLQAADTVVVLVADAAVDATLKLFHANGRR